MPISLLFGILMLSLQASAVCRGGAQQCSKTDQAALLQTSAAVSTETGKDAAQPTNEHPRLDRGNSMQALKTQETSKTKPSCIEPQLLEVPSMSHGPVQTFIFEDSIRDELNNIKFVDDEASAMFSFVHQFTEDNASLFEELPKRPASKPYLVWSHRLVCDPDDSCVKASTLARNREDFVFASFDLRDPWLTDNFHKPLPGVTMAPPSHFNSILRMDPEKTPKYFLTFRGKINAGWFGSSEVRPTLKQLWSQKQVKGTVVEFVDMDHTYNDEDKERYGDLLNTSYALVPHGDGRWNYRFTEVVNAYAIPVVIADGLTLPYTQLIDWSKAAIIVPESSLQYLSNPEGLIQLLPKDAKTIQAMRQEVRSISQKYFETPSKRWEAMLKSAAAYVTHCSNAGHVQ